ncbi:phospholipid scramblase 1-like [Scaptodrosophila lebanonensis]|uniref:Phospholipid scramblase n=1 Tax=Drosophila lebanonensis TaxID=7225 RepID=A0A6J2TDW8_DROLE|nr:phospholipid scramblase 1-like [Scaptodrosophila lebanonensis]
MVPGGMMPRPDDVPNCPPGLEYLAPLKQLFIKQHVEMFEVITGFETNNKYTIKNDIGQSVYTALEESDACMRRFCGSSRAFEMKIVNSYEKEVIHLSRPLACQNWCCPCCLQTLEVSAPPGTKIGSIVQEWSVRSRTFKVNNHLGDTVLRIKGPFCLICGSEDFNIISRSDKKVGKISKQWSGLARELFTDADFFGITFPLKLDPRIKAVLLGATFLIVRYIF